MREGTGLPAGVSRCDRDGPPTRRSSATPADSLRLTGERRLVSLTFASWNQVTGWLRRVDSLRRATLGSADRGDGGISPGRFVPRFIAQGCQSVRIANRAVNFHAGK